MRIIRLLRVICMGINSMKIYEIKVKTPWLLKRLLNIWEASVRTTYLFYRIRRSNKLGMILHKPSDFKNICDLKLISALILIKEATHILFFTWNGCEKMLQSLYNQWSTREIFYCSFYRFPFLLLLVIVFKFAILRIQTEN